MLHVTNYSKSGGCEDTAIVSPQPRLPKNAGRCFEKKKKKKTPSRNPSEDSRRSRLDNAKINISEHVHVETLEQVDEKLVEDRNVGAEAIVNNGRTVEEFMREKKSGIVTK